MDTITDKEGYAVDGGQKPRIYGACAKRVLTFGLN
jgi:hypothetical protein